MTLDMRLITHVYVPGCMFGIGQVGRLDVETDKGAESFALVDTTLSLLYNASHSRGLSNRLTRHISSLHANLDTKPVAIWQPQLDPNSLEYQIPTDAKLEMAKHTSIRKQQQLSRQSWNALGEVIRMAEGTAQLSLGRVIKNPR